MTICVVTDLGYGDCGKGTVVDHLARRGSAVVVRHNGGPQAGHNVVTPDGVHHCFSQFGSGTFAKASTFLSRFVLINPLNMMNEADHLIEIGQTDIWDRTFVDENAVLITPWHVAINRLEESARGDQRHGSCGQGVGVTVKQNLEATPLSVRVKDITDLSFSSRLEASRRYLQETYRHLASDTPEWEMILDEDLGFYLVYRFRRWLDGVTVVPSTYLGTLIQEHDQTIFEGAQGVLLDERYGFHPYTTWSNCTHENALTLLREIQSETSRATRAVPTPNEQASLSTFSRIGVLRAVTTRHGAGPHPTEDKHLTDQWMEPHNIHDPWQGSFRVGHLDLVAHRYAVRVCGGVDELAVTHLDRSARFRGEGWLYCPNYVEIDRIPASGDLDRQRMITDVLQKVTPVLAPADTEGLLSVIETHLRAPVTIMSYGPTCDDKRVKSSLEVQRR